jgi:hypothetical protein
MSGHQKLSKAVLSVQNDRTQYVFVCESQREGASGRTERGGEEWESVSESGGDNKI